MQPILLRDPSEAAGPQGCIDDLDKYWWGLWGRSAKDSYPTDRWFGHLHALQPPPAPVPITADMLRRVLARWSARKAPGPDGWRTRDLKDLPPDALEVVARFMALVEAAGRWPAKLTNAIVAMLPKKGTAAPDDRRPIVLMAILYRWWAKIRAGEVQDWLVE